MYELYILHSEMAEVIQTFLRQVFSFSVKRAWDLGNKTLFRGAELPDLKLQAMYFKTDGCPIEATADMHFCAAQGRDHTEVRLKMMLW
ncbi:hypothetical protein RB195_010533 [Necator americanus]|uniref:Uncharacterized protein n=1 Tax=Necator americanus TaxID=51031 RepID=A0ABR1CYT0_NECAM